MGSALSRPKYANTELGDILTQQYPPLFHAATNVPSFINSFRNFANIRHLTVRCPGQNPTERYRRDIVDYALISLRIAVERSPLTNLHKLSLSSLHPSALHYLRHVNGIGNVPSAGRRWKQIRKLHMSVESWDFNNPSNPGLDHLKIIDDYIRQLAPRLEKFSFSWIGGKGPCPIALAADARFAPPRSSKKLFHEVTSPMSPLPIRPERQPIHMPLLRYLQIRNAAMNAPQLRHLLDAHKDSVKEFDLENVTLTDNGNWDDALSPVSERRSWSHSSLSMASQYTLVASDISDDLSSPSAAVEAASRDLIDPAVSSEPYFFDDGETVTASLSDEILDTSEASESKTGFTTKIRKKKRSRNRKHQIARRDNHHDRPKHSRSVSEPEYKTVSAGSPGFLRSRSMPSQVSLFFSPAQHERLSQPSTHTSGKGSDKHGKHACSPATVSDPSISSPIISSGPYPVLLQPSVYDPGAAKESTSDGITAVQRNLEQEEAHRLLAENASARISALQRAKEAVMTKLTREFSKKHITPGRPGANSAVTACRHMVGRDIVRGAGSYYTGSSEFVLEDMRTMGSQTAMVPLMFSRA